MCDAGEKKEKKLRKGKWREGRETEKENSEQQRGMEFA
jgi:hypothetical protein